MKIVRFLKQHFPFFIDFRNAVQAPKAICILSFLFILIAGKMLTVEGQSISSFAFIILFMLFGSQFIWRFAIPFSYKRGFKDSEWTVGKEILWLTLELLTSISLCYILLYKIWNIPSGDYLDKALNNAIKTVVALQVLLIPLSVYIKKELVLQDFLSKAMKLNMILLQKRYISVPSIPEFKEAVFTSNDNHGDLKVNIENLLFVQVTDNYVEIQYNSENSIKKSILRNTLKSVQESLSETPYLFQCHRSYIINLKKVVSVSGNSRGYMVIMEGCSNKIPVSRNKVSEFDEGMSSMFSTT